MTHRFVALAAVVAVLNVSTASAQSPTLKSVMKEKVEHTERLLRPLIAGEFAAIEWSADRLASLTYTEVASWQGRPDTRYLEQASAFVRAVQTLREGARARDIERATMGYTAMVSACVGCHKQTSVMRVIGTGARQP